MGVYCCWTRARELPNRDVEIVRFKDDSARSDVLVVDSSVTVPAAERGDVAHVLVPELFDEIKQLQETCSTLQSDIAKLVKSYDRVLAKAALPPGPDNYITRTPYPVAMKRDG